MSARITLGVSEPAVELIGNSMSLPSKNLHPEMWKRYVLKQVLPSWWAFWFRLASRRSKYFCWVSLFIHVLISLHQVLYIFFICSLPTGRSALLEHFFKYSACCTALLFAGGTCQACASDMATIRNEKATTRRLFELSCFSLCH